MPTCIGCQRSFRNDRAYSSHYYRCADYQKLQEQAVTTSVTNLEEDIMAVDEHISRGNTPFRDDEAQTSPMDMETVTLSNGIHDIENPQLEPVIILYYMFTCSNMQLLQTPELEEPILYPSGRPKRSDRSRQLPARYRDVLPPVQETNFHPQHDEPAPEVLGDDPPQMDIDDNDNSNSDTSTTPYYDTTPNSYGIFQSFLGEVPRFSPHGTLDSLCDSPNFDVAKMKRRWWSGITRAAPLDSDSDSEGEDAPDTPSLQKLRNSYFRPFPNATTFLLMHWFYSGSSSKSLQELDSLVKKVMLDKDFNRAQLLDFNATRESQRLDNIKDSALAESLFTSSDGWRKTSVKIPVPFERAKHAAEHAAPMFELDTLYYRPIVEVIKEIMQDSDAQQFHLYPFKTYWHPDETQRPQRVFSDLYNSDAYIEEHESIRQAYSTSEIEAVIAPIMLWSDSTQLANFGTASLWPIYLFLANQSKYMRCKPGNFAANHIAYIPKVCCVL